MNITSILIKTAVILVVLYLLSLTGAITFPIIAAITSGTGSGITSILLFLLAIILLSVVGNLLSRGVKSGKKSGEGLILGFVGAVAMGGILAIFAQLNVPYTVIVNLAWTGTSWYSSFLSILFIGIPLMFVFLIGD
jgi:hypothetical protein